MRKVILCLLFAIAMVFGFIGCKNDAPNGSTGSDEQEWHEGNWSTTTCYHDYSGHFYFTKSEMLAAGYTEEDDDICIVKYAILDNPKFTKMIKAEAYTLSDGQLFATYNMVKVIPTDMEGFGNTDWSYGIINNRAYVDIGTGYYLTRNSDSNCKQIYYFDDGTTQTVYCHIVF